MVSVESEECLVFTTQKVTERSRFLPMAITATALSIGVSYHISALPETVAYVTASASALVSDPQDACSIITSSARVRREHSENEGGLAKVGQR
jgi:hypothetical protein